MNYIGYDVTLFLSFIILKTFLFQMYVKSSL